MLHTLVADKILLPADAAISLKRLCNVDLDNRISNIHRPPCDTPADFLINLGPPTTYITTSMVEGAPGPVFRIYGRCSSPRLKHYRCFISCIEKPLWARPTL